MELINWKYIKQLNKDLNLEVHLDLKWWELCVIELRKNRKIY